MATRKGKDVGKSDAKGKGFGFIEVPKDIGGSDLPVMEGFCTATLDAVHWGVSQTGNPKATLQFTVTSEIEGYPESLGARVLENCSLQPQALWKINQYYHEVQGEDIPEGRYSEEEFHEMIESALLGSEWNLSLQIGVDDKGRERTEIAKAVRAE